MTKSQAQKVRQLGVVLRAIKLKCLECSAHNLYEVKNCGIGDCAIYPYRLGQRKDNVKIIREKRQKYAKNTIVAQGLTERQAVLTEVAK